MAERRAVGAVAVATVLMLAGCGGGGGTTSATTAATTGSSTFAAKVDAACRPLADRIAKLSFPYPDFNAQAPDTATLPKVGRYLRSTNAALGYDGLLTRLKAYTPPAAEAAAYATLLARLKALIAFNDEQAAAAIAGDKAAFAATVKRAQSVTDDAHAAARKLGAPACAEL